MYDLTKNNTFQVVVATVFASTMILISGNGVADAVKLANDAPLPPPGPYGQIDSKGGITASKGVEPATPQAPKMPANNTVVPKLAVQGGKSPADIKQNVEITEPKFKRAMPSISQALQSTQPVAPVKPSISKDLQKISKPILGTRTMPRSRPTMPPQQMMPSFNGIAPQIQQYRYIPLPVYQSNFSYPQPPSFNGNVPGYWMPQMPHSNK